jgi:suppressor of ftsI
MARRQLAPVACALAASVAAGALGTLRAPVERADAASPPARQVAATCPVVGREHAALGVPASDLTCVELLSAPAAPGARGAAFLRAGGGPFTVPVTRDGVLRHRFVLEVEGLPPPAELGPYTRYVAWITPPGLSPMVALGEVRNGRVELGEGAFNTYLLLISAEGPAPVDERTGPLVLRGTSPAMILRPHDLPWIVAEMAGGGGGGTAGGGDASGGAGAAAGGAGAAGAPPPSLDHAAHGLAPGAVLPPGDPLAWRPPPMHPAVEMPQQMMALRPDVSAFLPFATGADAAAVPDARPRESVRLADGDTLVLEAAPVYRRVGGLRIPGYGFNGQSPGPLIEADVGATVYVSLRNRTPLPTAIHWHGIRLDAASDGVPGVTQAPIASGEAFGYTLRLPDEGTFWYHPHLREDVMQDLGLAGNLRVHPAGSALYGVVDREEVLILDDQLIGPEGPVPYGREAPVHALMGRFGDVLLVNGRDDWATDVAAGEVVRFHLTNAASTRTFNVSFGALPMKLVASDLGKLPAEAWVESVVLAPAERWVVEVRFPEAGEVPFENRVQAIDPVRARFFAEVHRLGSVRVAAGESGGEAAPRPGFGELREAPAVQAEVERLVAEHALGAPDRTLVLGLRTEGLPFPLGPLLGWEGVYRPPVEWAATMPEMDWLATGRAVEWLLRDPDASTENMEIDWRFRVGDRVRLRIVNDRDVPHAMQHAIHLHGQRFLVLAVDGEPNRHPAWKDTVLVPTGAVVDLLIELDNPGPWMLHCHIAEHLETGMMTVIQVDP